MEQPEASSRRRPGCSVAIITSPAPSHPSTTLLDAVIASLSFVSGLEAAPILIVFDGYTINEKNRTKKGRVTTQLAEAYEEYFERVQVLYGSNARFTLLRLEDHMGFAFAVKRALEEVSTNYAVVCQHDRVFCSPFHYLSNVIRVMQEEESIRYVGFCIESNKKYVAQMETYGFSILTREPMQKAVGESEGLFLQPLLFLYDSQFLVQCDRYLQIFKPWINLPPVLKSELGLPVIKQLRLRRGDFIEDRFGQQQHQIMLSMRGRSDHDICRTFNWFGSYITWMPSDEMGRESSVLVKHLRGRQFNPNQLQINRKEIISRPNFSSCVLDVVFSRMELKKVAAKVVSGGDALVGADALVEEEEQQTFDEDEDVEDEDDGEDYKEGEEEEEVAEEP